MKTLILTEKPSVAKDFATALKVNGKQNGYYENNSYCITWAVGHLVELYEPQDYDQKWSKWHMASLPIIPDRFLYRPIPKAKNQLNIIQKLLKRKDIQDVVIATDAGREGEVIARTILLSAQFNNYQGVHRFWTSQALTPKVITDEMQALKPLSTYDRLWKAGQARQIADWLVGMNGSRAASIKLSDLFSIGRVQTAVLSLLTDRLRQREAFQPEPYWILRVLFENEKGQWWGTWYKAKVSRFEKETDAQATLERIKNQSGQILSVKKQKKKIPPPPLYSLTDLQQDANKRFGFSAKKTLQLAQTLYEDKKCLSYPRTDAKVLGSQNVDLAQSIIDKLSMAYPEMFSGIDPKRVNISNKRVFNDAQLTDHHALIPLDRPPQTVSADERAVYDLVLKRFAAAFHPDHIYEQTDIITQIETDTFQTKGKIILVPGWQGIYQDSKMTRPGKTDEAILPPLVKGDPANMSDHKLEKKMTSPPPQYTDALLLKDMTNPGRYISEDDLKKIFRSEIGLGTQATRAQIIETLLSRQYIFRQKRFLIATQKGCRLIDTLRQFKVSVKLTSPEETARWEQQLHSIAQGQESETEFIENIQQFVIQLVSEIKDAPVQKQTPTTLGTCPKCEGNVIEGKKGYGCANWKKEDGACTFVVWKKQAGRLITRAMIQHLLKTKSCGPFGGFINDRGEKFTANLQLIQQENEWSITLKPIDSEQIQTALPKIGPCPACGGEIVDTPKAFGCANWKSTDGACTFKIWKTIAKKTIPHETAIQLLEYGVTDVIEGFISKKGTPFSCRLILHSDKSGQYAVNFHFSNH